MLYDHPLVAFHFWLQPKDKALPSSKETQLVPSSPALAPVSGQVSPTDLFCCCLDEEQSWFMSLAVGIEPAQTTAMFQGGEKQEGLAQCKSLWDP